ncbi:hypothetical protein GIB67_005388 [Kingdonia uniflora]|uniref:Protein kinase domain-containing protein n=1 Tax=Kingdonia uniflora TaxID=39325 RepID=A0A7J7NH59_9MAGN|nr:hypothetical protein GIB67_005388 [Kingdonia uniflora]
MLKSEEEGGAKKVIIAVRAEKEISQTALAWALTHIINSGDSITLLAVFPKQNKGRKFWSFSGDCGGGGGGGERSPDRICQISEFCSHLVLQFHQHNKVGVRIKVVSAGAVAAESKKAGANWVVLDKQLKNEEKHCLEELHCNIVVMKRSQPKVLRLNLEKYDEVQYPFSSSEVPEVDIEVSKNSKIKYSTPVSSPEDLKTSFTRTTTEEASVSTSDGGTSPFFVCERNPLFEGHNKRKPSPVHERVDSNDSVASSDPDEEALSQTRDNGDEYWTPPNNDKTSIIIKYENFQIAKGLTSRSLLQKFVDSDHEVRNQRPGISKTSQIHNVLNSDVRNAVLVSRNVLAPPPLCSICQHKGPVFGKPPRWFAYKELKEATNGFSEANFLAEGGFGSVHRGVLRDGQVVAVKQLKVYGSQGDTEFCREVGVLSCAQHKNVVMLIGFCVEGRNRVLVYEFVCNGSLDLHLYGNKRDPLDWKSRFKIAIGAARGLRYLHEDCRVGCIAHRDMRPNNILLTHDYEPLVGDFGLARWQPELDLGADLRVVGTLGYLAPEYIEGAKITEKADVYAFGVILLELITGQKTMDMAHPKGQKFLAEWSRPLFSLEEDSRALAINNLMLDPSLNLDQLHDCSHQLRSMARAAHSCLRRDPESRPPMSKVLRIIEGDDAIIPLILDSDPIGSRSGRLRGLSSNTRTKLRGHYRKLSN